MLYCADCQVLSKDGIVCPLCGKKKLRPVRADDPVFLLSVNEQDSLRIAASFDEAGIPHMERSLDAGGYLSIVLGQSRTAGTRIFVPFAEIDHAKEILYGIGIVNDGEAHAPDQHRKEPDAKKEEEKEELPMGTGKRVAVRVFSILLFFVIITVVVYLADGIINFFKTFHLFH